MRNSVLIEINGALEQVHGSDALMTLADFLRYRRGLTGTKIVCAEGDCGACTVLVRSQSGSQSGSQSEPNLFETINSCIHFVWQMDGCQIITVEGLRDGDQLHPAQTAMIDCHGAQCGYCTPGFVCSLAQLTEEVLHEGTAISRKRAQNCMTGNLCRCTGYEPILTAACSIQPAAANSLTDRYPVINMPTDSVLLKDNGREVFLPTTLAEAKQFCADPVQIVSGSTDLGVLHNKGRWEPRRLMSLRKIAELDFIEHNPENVVIGANVSLTRLSKELKPKFPEFSRMLRIFASPQIKNAATLVGNLMNASPIADSIPFLRVADARIHLQSPTDSRVVNIDQFILPGYKQLDRKPDEFVSHIELPVRAHNFKLYKVSQRKDLDISAVTVAFAYVLRNGKFVHFAIALGGVGPSVLRFPSLEANVTSQPLTSAVFHQLAAEIDQHIAPLSDVRGSAGYRRLLIRNLMLKFVDEIAAEEIAAEEVGGT